MSRVGSSVWASDALPLAAAVEAEEEELVLVVSPATVDACDACSRSVMNAPLAVVSGGVSAGAGRTCAAVSSSSGGSYIHCIVEIISLGTNAVCSMHDIILNFVRITCRMH